MTEVIVKKMLAGKAKSLKPVNGVDSRVGQIVRNFGNIRAEVVFPPTQLEARQGIRAVHRILQREEIELV